MECISCHSGKVVCNGHYKDFQNFKCKNCGRQFSERSFSFFCRHRFPDEVIKSSLLLGQFVSTRIIKFLVGEMQQFRFSHVTVFRWLKKFAKHVARKIFRGNFSSVWHVDEKFIKVRGCKDFAYLWVVIDDKNSIIAVHISEKRDINGAKAVLRLAKQRAEKPPSIIVTDGLHAYKQACRKVFGRKIKHVIAHFKAESFMHLGKWYQLSNNRIESLNSKLNLWYKKHRGFKNILTALLWCNMWMFFYNFMRPRVIPHEIVSIHKVLA